MHRGGTRPPHLGKMRESLATRHVARGTWHVARRMGAIAMETAEGIARLRRLRTVRRFTDQPVGQAGLDALLSGARWSGSANTRQPWVFSVVRERETRRRLAELAGDAGHLAGASPTSGWCGRPSPSATRTLASKGRASTRRRPASRSPRSSMRSDSVGHEWQE
jgi:nitroreductase